MLSQFESDILMDSVASQFWIWLTSNCQEGFNKMIFRNLPLYLFVYFDSCGSFFIVFFFSLLKSSLQDSVGPNSMRNTSKIKRTKKNRIEECKSFNWGKLLQNIKGLGWNTNFLFFPSCYRVKLQFCIPSQLWYFQKALLIMSMIFNA